MPAPVASREILATDTTNTGKKLRSHITSVSAQAVHVEFYVPAPAYNITGHYFFSSPQQSVQASPHDGVNNAFFFVFNPEQATTTTLIRRITIDCNASAALSASVNTVISVNKYTWSGTPLQASSLRVFPAVTGQPWPQLTISASSTGMLPIYEIADIAQIALPLVTSQGFIYLTKDLIAYNPLVYKRGACLEIGPGEGISIYQSTAGNAGDTRRIGIQIEWDEINLN